MNSWTPIGSNQAAFFFEDDIEVSPLFFKWALDNMSIKNDQIIGISLYTPKIDEINPNAGEWNPHKFIQNSDRFLFQLPCSWGALYYSSFWISFKEYYEQRHSLNLMIVPDARSNQWKRSWKK